MSSEGRRVALPLAAVIAAAAAVTLSEGAPAGLPGVALGSTVLLHVERAAALFAIVVAVVSVLSQAARGRLPTQLSTGGLAYQAELAGDTGAAVDQLQEQLDDVQETVALLAGRLDALEPSP